MVGDGAARVTVSVEIVLDVTDAAALERAALAAIDVAEFGVVQAGVDDAAVRAAEADEVRGDAVAALAWLIDPEKIVGEIPGVSAGRVSWEVFPTEGDEADVA